MSSLKADFNELMERIKQGREFGHASFEPIFYLVFPPSQILNVKRETPAWIHRLKNEGWDVATFSIAEHIADIIDKAPLRKIWVAADQKAPQAWEKTNASLANAIINGALQARIEAKLSDLVAWVAKSSQEARSRRWPSVRMASRRSARLPFFRKLRATVSHLRWRASSLSRSLADPRSDSWR
jgi:hypothetical protein